MFLGVEHMSPSLFSLNSTPPHLRAGGMEVGWLLQRGATCLFTGVREASVGEGEGQPNGGAVSLPHCTGGFQKGKKGGNQLYFIYFFY